MDRRHFLRRVSYGTAALGIAGGSGHESRVMAQGVPVQGRRLPYKFGIRQASLRNPEDAGKGMLGNFDTFKVAQDIPGITGVELQVTSGNPNMRDLSVARRYKAEAHRWGLDIPTTAGVWNHEIWGAHAGLDLVNSIRATEIVGARIMLVAFFRNSAPDMRDEDSYGPVVSLLREVAPKAEEAGIVLSLENSLSPADNKLLVEMVDHSAVKVYYDIDNMFQYGHGDVAVPGIELLGNENIVAVHAKNDGRLLQVGGRIDWAAAFQGLTRIGYDGWIVFETRHDSHEDAREATQQNIAFVQQHFTPPLA